MRQLIFERIGKEGCYFLSIVKAAELVVEHYIDAYQAYTSALSDELIKENCFINSPDKLMGMLTGLRWSVSKEPADYIPSRGEVEILRFERNEGMATIGHFVLGDGHGSVAYDPYGKSRTVAEGKLISKRILKRV